MMNVPASGHSSVLSEGANICGYRLKKIVELKDQHGVFYELEHMATGCRHVHISSRDKENTFSVAFKTVPEDSTGVAHILEHTVLCGSRRYPVRDPFFSMLKRGLSTFMNAFTASDWTMYPFCTQNRKDFYNILDVYLDAVFFPNLNDLSFKQEGHRLELETTTGKDPARLVYKGVVYNEMKGAMSSPDQVMERSLMNALYPSSTYRFNSGGEPSEIPKLTHQELVEFHRRHYHPSNAFFYTYGNLPLEEHLTFIQEKVLTHFTRIDPETDVPPQPRWTTPKTATYTYPLGKNEDPLKKCQISMAWLMADIRDSFEILALTLLEQILLGNAASPLRKALIDSGLGTSLSDGTGYDGEHRDTSFACGLKDVEESSADRIESIIVNVFQELVANGIERELIDSAVHQLEFYRKEVTNQPYPYGLKLLLEFSGSWFHGGDPVNALQFDADLRRLDSELEKGPFFEQRIQRYFLDNPHRVLLKLIPDQLKESREAGEVVQALERRLEGMTRSELDQIIKDADALKALQEFQEDVSCLPTLGLEDIPPEVDIVKENSSFPDVPATCYQQPTSGILYVSAAFGAGQVAGPLLSLVPFFCYAFSKMGTRRRDYTEIARRMDLYTGGIGLSINARTRFDSDGVCLPFALLGGKCLARNQDQMFELLDELLCEGDYSDLNRLKKLLLQYRAGIESMVVQNGHGFAISLASRNFSRTCALSERWNGIFQLKVLKTLTDDLTDETLESLSQDMSRIAGVLIGRQNIRAALVGEEDLLTTAGSKIASLQEKLDSGPSDGFVPPPIDVDDYIPREGWSTSTSVSFVARMFKAVRMGHEDAPALSVISKLLRSMYLHREIREKGGAYGGFAVYNSENGLFGFASYRDPHIASTLKVYEGGEAFIRSGACTDGDIKEAVLQVCSEIDRPDPPGPAARNAFFRKIVSLSDEQRQEFKSRLLSMTRREVMRVAETYFDRHSQKSAVVVISGEEALKRANEKLGQYPLELHQI